MTNTIKIYALICFTFLTIELFNLLSWFQCRNALQRSYSTASVPTTKMFIDGKFVDSKTTEWIDLHDPATNQVVTRVPKCTQGEMESAVESSKKAFKTWSQTSILGRQQVMFKLQHLIRNNMSELAKNITKEQGKTLVDAEGDVLRGLRKLSRCLCCI